MATFVNAVLRLSAFLLYTKGCNGDIDIPSFSPDIYAMEGDINLGALLGITGSDSEGFCTNSLQYYTNMEFVEAVAYGVKMVNKDKNLLANITLGFVIIDDCWKDIAALAGAVYFVPQEAENGSCEAVQENGVTMPKKNFKVAGVVGGDTSREAVMVSSFLSIFRIPILSPSATSDELSDKSRFKYFLRMVPPDMYQAYTIVDTLEIMNWTYVSFLYSEGSYGENGAKQFEHRIRLTSICVAVSHRIPSVAIEEDYDKAVRLLDKHYKARVVVIFLESKDQAGLYKALGHAGLDKYFILFGSDYTSHMYYGERGDGNLAIILPRTLHVDFIDYYLNLNPVNNKANPWMKRYWELVHVCSWLESNSTKYCQPFYNKTAEISEWADIMIFYIDSVTTFAYAIDYVIKMDCPGAKRHKYLLESCIQGPRLLEVLKNLTFQGYTSTIDFDELGNRVGTYGISQYRHATRDYETVAMWDQNTMTLQLFNDKIRWDILQRKVSNSSRLSQSLTLQHIPESICSKPCNEKEYYVQKDLSCCWECHTCRNNEIIINNFTDCMSCPPLLWPDNDTATLCETIEPTYLKWLDPTAIALALTTALGVVANVTILILYVLNRDQKLIKASSRELSMIILIGIFLAFISVFPGLTKPSFLACSLNRYGFNMAVSLMYAPLMVRTNRIYRIFEAGKRGTKKPNFIGSRSQVVIILLLLIIQVILSVVCGNMAPPYATLRMQIPTEKHVELFCELPLVGFLPPLVYNIFLMLLCAVFGFLTRKLPANFNESWFIFISVSTTSFLWVVILPTYFNQFYAYNQAALLSVCLIINATVSLVLLFVPKIYAIYFVEEEKMSLGTTSSKGKTQVVPLSTE